MLSEFTAVVTMEELEILAHVFKVFSCKFGTKRLYAPTTVTTEIIPTEKLEQFFLHLQHIGPPSPPKNQFFIT